MKVSCLVRVVVVRFCFLWLTVGIHSQVALAEERRRRKEEKAIRIEAEEEMRRAQDQRDKLEFELSVIVDEIGLVHHAMED